MRPSVPERAPENEIKKKEDGDRPSLDTSTHSRPSFC